MSACAQDEEGRALRGVELARLFFHEVVQQQVVDFEPSLAEHLGAALLGSGSEVLGFDTDMSRDHDWGPRVLLFLPHRLIEEGNGSAIEDHLTRTLPGMFRGYSVHFSAKDPDDNGTQVPAKASSGEPVNHRVRCASVLSFLHKYIGAKTLPDAWSVRDWLVVPQSKLRGIVSGGVFADPLGELEALRSALQYYPDDVWMYVLAGHLYAIGQEEAFVGRTAGVGDDLGSRLITARIVHHVMCALFALDRQYTPYSKWFGSAFRHLSFFALFQPMLVCALDAADFESREQALCDIYCSLLRQLNSVIVPRVRSGRLGPQGALGGTSLWPVREHCVPFHSRPFRVMGAGEISDAVRALICDEALLALSRDIAFGNVDCIAPQHDLLSSAPLCHRMSGMFAPSPSLQ